MVKVQFNLSIGQEGVHSLQEGRVEDVGLVHDKHNLLPLAAGATENVPEVVVKVHSRVLPVDLGTWESHTDTDVNRHSRKSNYNDRN